MVKEDFDYIKAIEDMEIPTYLKKGFIYRINEKDIKIKSEKDLEKEFNKFIKGV